MANRRVHQNNSVPTSLRRATAGVSGARQAWWARRSRCSSPRVAERSRQLAESFRESPRALGNPPKGVGTLPRVLGSRRKASATCRRGSGNRRELSEPAERSRRIASSSRQLAESSPEAPRVVGGPPKGLGDSPRALGSRRKVSATCRKASADRRKVSATCRESSWDDVILLDGLGVPECQNNPLIPIHQATMPGLVERVLDWPGVHTARSILEDVPLKGYWFDRTQEYAARNRGEEYGRLTYATEETFVLSRLPCWEHLSPEAYRKRVAELVEEIELDARVVRMERGTSVLVFGAVLRQNPHTRPNKTKKSPAPRFPRREQGDSERSEGSLLPLPGRIPGCGRVAQGR